MSKKGNFNDEILIDQPDMGCYYPQNMFRFPEEDMMRPMPPPPPMKSTTIKTTSVTSQPVAPPTDNDESMLSPTLSNIGFTQAYLRTLIGKRVRVSFLIGTNMLVDRVGTLVDVGISYIVLRQLDANINVMCDLYSIKFVDIFNS